MPWGRNPRKIKQKNAELLIDSAETFGQIETLAIGPDGELYNGHQRLSTWIAEFGPDYEVDVRVSDRPLTEKEREQLTVYLHRGAAGEWDFDVLADEFELDDLLDWGFEPGELGIDDSEEPPPGGAGDAEPPELKVSLSDRFLVPPFSVLDARQGYWQDRKRAWLSIGIQSELGRGEEMTWQGEQVISQGLNCDSNLSPGGG